MEIPKGFQFCFKCKKGVNLIDNSVTPPERREVEFQGHSFLYKFSLKCNKCDEILHHFIPYPETT